MFVYLFQLFSESWKVGALRRRKRMKYLGHTINLNKNDVFLSLFFALFSIFSLWMIMKCVFPHFLFVIIKCLNEFYFWNNVYTYTFMFWILFVSHFILFFHRLHFSKCFSFYHCTFHSVFISFSSLIRCSYRLLSHRQSTFARSHCWKWYSCSVLFLFNQ